MHPRRHGGFTLIELLVVIFIISIITGAAMLSLGQHQSATVKRTTKQLSELLLLAEQQAMLQSMVIGVLIDDGSVNFLRLVSQGEGQSSRWEPLHDATLKSLTLPASLSLTLQSGKTRSLAADEEDQEKTEASLTPQLVISMNGDVTPFTLYLGNQGSQPSYVILGESDGAIHEQAL